MLVSSISAQTTTYTHLGGASGDLFGSSVGGLDDVNGDGFGDYMVTAFGADAIGINTGAARVYSGKDSTTLYTLIGSVTGEVFGFSATAAGDVNGDGTPDIIVGAIGADTNGTDAGNARVFSGSNGTLIYTLLGDSANDRFGFSVDGAGDVNNDGFDDFIVGTPADNNFGFSSGSARVFSGIDGSILYTLNGIGAGDFFGKSVSGAGDVDNDGFADIIVGSPGDDTVAANTGSVQVFSGFDGSVLHFIAGLAIFDFFGAQVTGVGDVNADGFDDFAVSAPAADVNGPDSGSVTVFSGITGGVLHTFHGNSAADLFGSAVSAAGDVNGDGFADVVVGTQNDDAGGSLSGSVTIFSGIDGSVIKTLIGQVPGRRLGSAVGGVGDMNGDGFADIIVGAIGAQQNGEQSGSAEVLFSDTLPILSYSSSLGQHNLQLNWLPNGGDINALMGTLTCSGATPGGLGVIAVSLAPADVLIFGFPLLVAGDPTNLILMGNLGYSAMGDFLALNVSRQVPSIAGSLMHIQFFESGPILGSSNGIRLLVVP